MLKLTVEIGTLFNNASKASIKIPSLKIMEEGWTLKQLSLIVFKPTTIHFPKKVRSLEYFQEKLSGQALLRR